MAGFRQLEHGEKKLRELSADAEVQAFVEALYEAKPVAADALFEQGIYETGPSEQKFLYIQLQDGTEVQLRLFKAANMCDMPMRLCSSSIGRCRHSPRCGADGGVGYPAVCSLKGDVKTRGYPSSDSLFSLRRVANGDPFRYRIGGSLLFACSR